MASQKYTTALTIAGSDCSGGAGIQADLKTFCAMGCYGISVITALTAQNTQGVQSVESVPVKFIREQLQSIFDDIRVDAVKIGMLHRPEVVRVIATTLRERRPDNVVLDPVMVAKSGDKLLTAEAVAAVKEELLPLVTVVTPNLPEIATLLDAREPSTVNEMRSAGRALLELGTPAVLVKGGHLAGEDAIDILLDASSDREYRSKRIETKNSHGTGCTLSSAIAAYLAKGLALEDAVGEAKRYLTGALREGALYELGRGKGPVHHLWRSHPNPS